MTVQCSRCAREITNERVKQYASWHLDYIWFCAECCLSNLPWLRETGIWSENSDQLWIKDCVATYWYKNYWDHPSRLEKLMTFAIAYCQQCGGIHQ